MVTEDYILKKFKGQPPSLIVHLHPTYFRFDQQDGSFGYQSEMRFFLEHLQKRTVPHDILEELKKSDVRFYDGWLIVRVVDHKSSTTDSTTSSVAAADDQTPFSVNNYTPYVTPSPYAPYPSKDQPKPDPAKQKSTEVKTETEDGTTTESSVEKGKSSQSKQKASEPKVYHVALRPTALSQHQDIVIDSMTPDPKSLNRRQSQAPGRNPGAPPTPLSGVPTTPVMERGHIAKKQKMKIEAKDLVEYEARIINATAPPLWLDPVQSLEEAEILLDMLMDPFHHEQPPSPKGRKRTVAQLAADEAIKKEEERFMLIMDEQKAPAAGAAGSANAASSDAQNGIPLFQPRFERFNALENIKATHKENKRIEHEKKIQADHERRIQQEQAEEQRRKEAQMRAEVEKRNRAMAQARNEAMARQQAQAQAQQQQQQQQQAQQQQAQQQQQQHAMPQVNGMMPGMQHQQQRMLQASQAPIGSPVVRAMSPHVTSSPVVGNMSAPGHSVPMNVTSSNQGGSPPRPGSAMQHAHPGVQMVRNVSQQGMSRQGTPHMPQATPNMRQATPVMRTSTPSQRMNAGSPQGNMMGATPQMAQTSMMATPQMAAAHLSAQQAMLQQRQLQLQQQQQQMQAQGHQMSNTEMVHFQAQQHALQQQRLAAHQQMMQHAAAQQGQHGSPNPNGGQFGPNQQAYNAQVAQMMKQQMAHAAQVQGQGQGSPQQHGFPMGINQQQRPGSGGQSGAQNSYAQERFAHHRRALLGSAAQQYGGNPNSIPPPALENINRQAQLFAQRDMKNAMIQRQMARQGMQGQAPNPQQQMMMNQQMQASMMAQMQQQQRAQQMGNHG